MFTQELIDRLGHFSIAFSREVHMDFNNGLCFRLVSSTTGIYLLWASSKMLLSLD